MLLGRSLVSCSVLIRCSDYVRIGPVSSRVRSLGYAAEALKGLPQTPGAFPAAKLQACAGPVASPYGTKQPSPEDLPAPSSWNRRFHALEADPNTIPPPARTLEELKQQLKEREGNQLPTPITLPPRSISKPDTFEQWLYEKEIWFMEKKFYNENVPADFRRQRLPSGKWVRSRLGAKEIANLRKQTLLHGLIWPWEAPISPRRPTIFKGRLRQIKQLEMHARIEANMARMPEMIAEYRKRIATYRQAKRYEKMFAVERLLNEPPK
eukprot:gb/GEZN01011725.1/.p1 GENE.gb/GEZN01011725.1/~~gb/GEZN01011725.1/.p1  ORF type:complete len:299 (-),score=32.28 gb/GEZN01011725.1/:239-1036(-)